MKRLGWVAWVLREPGPAHRDATANRLAGAIRAEPADPQHWLGAARLEARDLAALHRDERNGVPVAQLDHWQPFRASAKRDILRYRELIGDGREIVWMHRFPLPW